MDQGLSPNRLICVENWGSSRDYGARPEPPPTVPVRVAYCAQCLLVGELDSRRLETLGLLILRGGIEGELCVDLVIPGRGWRAPCAYDLRDPMTIFTLNSWNSYFAERIEWMTHHMANGIKLLEAAMDEASKTISHDRQPLSLDRYRTDSRKLVSYSIHWGGYVLPCYRDHQVESSVKPMYSCKIY